MGVAHRSGRAAAGEQPLLARVLNWSYGSANAASKRRSYGDQSDQMLGLVARHPVLELRQLATLLDTSPRRVQTLLYRLTEPAGSVCCSQAT
jgi:hypothetical protein